MQPSNIDSRVARRRQPRVACVSVRDPLADKIAFTALDDSATSSRRSSLVEPSLIELPECVRVTLVTPKGHGSGVLGPFLPDRPD